MLYLRWSNRRLVVLRDLEDLSPSGLRRPVPISLEASKVIFEHMRQFAHVYYGTSMPALSFEEIEPILREVFASRGSEVVRVARWQQEVARRFERVEYSRDATFGPRRHFKTFLRDQMKRAESATR